MEKKEHPHAHVLRWIADGEEIEVCRISSDEDWMATSYSSVLVRIAFQGADAKRESVMLDKVSTLAVRSHFNFVILRHVIRAKRETEWIDGRGGSACSGNKAAGSNTPRTDANTRVFKGNDVAIVQRFCELVLVVLVEIHVVD